MSMGLPHPPTRQAYAALLCSLKLGESFVNDAWQTSSANEYASVPATESPLGAEEEGFEPSTGFKHR